jgi:hypothetical protein
MRGLEVMLRQLNPESSPTSDCKPFWPSSALRPVTSVDTVPSWFESISILSIVFFTTRGTAPPRSVSAEAGRVTVSAKQLGIDQGAIENTIITTKLIRKYLWQNDIKLELMILLLLKLFFDFMI